MNNSGKANGTEIGSGMNGKGMEHGSPVFIPLPLIPLPSALEVLAGSFAALRWLRRKPRSLYGRPFAVVYWIWKVSLSGKISGNFHRVFSQLVMKALLL